ncbi:hypothetical protein [Ligilactobacillus salitolerans]|uniref:hypothetical protein n=1 Tax=Ligilactobacillus salitolerans TaxID=1808352 RepID=UPI000F60821B|nr:hypothetical protein [Ligilactobacillus salitolerans]
MLDKVIQEPGQIIGYYLVGSKAGYKSGEVCSKWNQSGLMSGIVCSKRNQSGLMSAELCSKRNQSGLKSGEMDSVGRIFTQHTAKRWQYDFLFA